MSIRLEFVAEALGRRRRFTALCEQYGISEKTGYKWLARFRARGPAGLADASHTPHSCPHATPASQRELLAALRRTHPTWGARKLRVVLQSQHPTLEWPAASTITTLLHREGLIQARRRRRRPGSPAGERGPVAAARPNALWTIDYKGQFRTRDGRWCYPLTVVDAASRYLLACVAQHEPTTVGAVTVLRQCFRRYGLPDVLLSDNGPPFGAARAPRGFSRLSLWVRTLGIEPRFIVPGHPEQNGRHERLHRTLKADATRPAAASLHQQQHRFNHFRVEYNSVRPHEALGLRAPADVYSPSPRVFIARPQPLAYPPHFHERRVTSAGLVWWHHQDIYVSSTLAGHTIGLDPVSPSNWDVYFADYLLGTMDLTTLRFTPLTQALTSPINPV
jgi:transposase InsO family protein